MPTPVLIATTTNGAASGTSLILTKPSGLADGDVLVALVRGQGTATSTTQAAITGFTAAHNQALTDRVHMILYKVVTSAAGEGSSYTVNTNGGSGRIVGALQIWRGVDTASPIGGTHAYAALSGTSQTLTSWTVDSSSDAFAVINLFSDERTAGQSHVPTTIPSGYSTNVNEQSTLDASTSGSRTSIWSGYIASTGTTTISAATLVMPTGATGPRASAIALRGAATAPVTGTGNLTLSGTAVASQPGAPVTGTGTLTLSGTADVSGGTQIRSASGTLTISGSATALNARPGFASVTQLLATQGATIAHRGGSVTYPEMSEYAYTQSVLLGYGALEFSCGWSSDDVPFGLADSTLDRVAGVSGSIDPKTIPWANISSTYENKTNPVSAGVYQPFYRLVDFLDKFTPTHVVAVDPKFGVTNPNYYMPILLDICDAHGGPSKIIIKFDSAGAGGIPIATAAHSRGYTTMNYWGSNTTAMASEQSNWDIIGALYSDATAMAQANTYGKPSWAAIVPNQTGYNTAITNGANLVMVSGVASVTPISAGPLGTGTLTLSGTAVAVEREIVTASGSMTLSGSATVVELEIVTGTGTMTLSGSAIGVPSFTSTSTVTATLSGTADVSAIESRTATGALTLSGTAAGDVAGGIVTRTAQGTLTLTAMAVVAVVLSGSDSATLSGSAQVSGGTQTRTGTGALTISGSAIGSASGGEVVRTALGTLTIAGSADAEASGGTQTRTATGTLVLNGYTTESVRFSVTANGIMVLSGIAQYGEGAKIPDRRIMSPVIGKKLSVSFRKTIREVN